MFDFAARKIIFLLFEHNKHCIDFSTENSIQIYTIYLFINFLNIKTNYPMANFLQNLQAKRLFVYDTSQLPLSSYCYLVFLFF